MTLTHFWGVGEEKPGTLYEGESPSKTATKFSQGIVGFVLTTYQPCKRTNNFSRSVDYYGYPLINARNASKNRIRLLDHNEISMTLDISSPVLPTFRESAMTHLHTLLAPQDLSLLSWLMSSKGKDTIK